MPNFKQSLELIRNMGFRYVGYRIGHVAKTRVGYYSRKFPIAPVKQVFISLDLWRSSSVKWFLPDYFTTEKVEAPPRPSCLDGQIKFFNIQIKNLGLHYDWLTNPETGFKYEQNKHWSLIADFSPHSGDIKFVWEKSRFAFIYDLIRYDAYYGTDHSDWLWKEMLSWIKANPINAGPNFKCSQEISLRTIAWISALDFYRSSSSLTPEIFSEFQHVLYWQLKHVYDHIDFSLIAVRNNHAITETLGLFIGGTLFPEFPNAAVWAKKGKKWFEQEIAYQIYEDGTYLQFSMNYHRAVVQLLSLAISFTQANKMEFDPVVYQRAYASLDFLYHCQDTVTGFLPNYGSNDGALFFPLSNCDYRDYRPQLNALHYLLTGISLYPKGAYSEETFWWNADKLSLKKFSPLVLLNGWRVFPLGGYALLREKNGLSFIRCGKHKDRPAQADNMHLDIWLNGENLLHDSGSYKYNTTLELTAWFMGTLGHNSVMLDDHGQMLKGPRFIWFNWTQAQKLEVFEAPDYYEFIGQISAFGQLASNIKHRRSIIKYKDEDRWVISDEILNKPDDKMIVQIWHPKTNALKFQAIAGKNELTPEWDSGWESQYYGVKEKAGFLKFRTKENSITTTIQL